MSLLGTSVLSISTDTGTTVILGIESKNVRVGFGDTEGLITMAGRVVADMDHVVLVAAGVISGRTEVSRSVLTSGSINWLGLFVNKLAAVFVFTLVIRGVGNTLRNTVNLECVLNSWKVQGFRRVATFGNIGIIHGNAEGMGARESAESIRPQGSLVRIPQT